MEDYKNKLGALAGKLKQERPQTPIQQVQPVRAKAPKEKEVQFNNWLPKSLIKQVKRFALEQERTIKDVLIEALQHYLKTNSKST
ncbi:hypothetical protein ACFQZS_03145 [Mucilaginibacter calamicampi]|uniref:CopG family transcriptional regulator n=1 Tax=Mucilaginibacter calamicampi TaxID=1302352 RepID=A0ABW2YSW9_9SPHI